MPRPSLLPLTLSALLSGAAALSIPNTASLSARGVRVNSNTVELTRVAPCDPRVTPDGSAAQPARTLDLATPGSLLIPYQLTQAGDVPGPVRLSVTLSGAPAGARAQVQAPGGEALDSVPLAPGETRTVNVALLVPQGAQGELDVNLAAQCGASSDPLNVTRVRLSPQVNLLLTHTVTPARSEVGRTVPFTLRLPNPAARPITPELTVTLPAGLSVVPGSARSGDRPVPATSGADGRVTFTPGPLEPGATLTVTYDALITPQALPDPGTERTLQVPATARAQYAGQTLVAPEARASLIVAPGVFDRRGTVIGEVFLDANGNGRRDPDDSPLAGARVLLANGQQTLTDEQGRYALRDLTPGPWLLRLDAATAPFEPVPGLGARLVDVFALTRVDFALRLPGAQPAPAGTLAAPRDTTVRSGPVVVTRRVTAQPGGASLITLELSSARPVADVTVTDRAGPDEPPRSFRMTLLSGPVTFSYLTLTPAGPNDPDVLWREP